MKILNNDLKELESAIIWWCSTRWDYQNEDKQKELAINYLQSKYPNDNFLTKWLINWIEYLKNLNEDDMIFLIDFAKKIFIEKFGLKNWSIAFVNFIWSLMQDWEKYSDTINMSIKINNILLKEFNETFKYFSKRHKYEIWKYINIIKNNLNIPIWWSDYEYWENYTFTN